LQAAILHPDYADVGFTASWILDSLEVNYETLVGLDNMLRMEKARIEHLKKAPIG